MLATDLVGTPFATLRLDDGTLVGTQLRTPYGQARYSSASSANGGLHTSFGFTGQHEDGAAWAPGSSGLDYFNARYYDPLIGRFTSADDVVSSDPLLDGYAYVGGRVESTTDPSGHDPIPWWLPLLPTPLQAGVVVGGAAVGLTVWVFSGNADQDLAWDRTDVVYPYGYVQPSGPDIRLGPYGNPYRGVIVDQSAPDFGPTGKPLPRRRTPPAAPVGKPGTKPGPVPAPGGGGRGNQPPTRPTAVCGCGLGPLYRALRPGEDPTQGLYPRNPGNPASPLDHVRFGSKPWYPGDQYISFTKDATIALEKYAGGDTSLVVRVDSSMVQGTLIDLSTDTGRLAAGITPANRMAWAFAKHDSEVLLEGYVPPEAISPFNLDDC